MASEKNKQTLPTFSQNVVFEVCSKCSDCGSILRTYNKITKETKCHQCGKKQPNPHQNLNNLELDNNPIDLSFLENEKNQNLDNNMKTDEYWKHNLTNAEVFGDAEKRFWVKIEPFIIDLLNELKKNGKIRSDYEITNIENSHLINLFENRNKILENFNVFAQGIAKKEEMPAFVEKVVALGFHGYNFAHMLIEFSAFMTITDLECFKTLILFCMKDVDYHASKFNKTMEKNAPISWAKLKPIVLNDFRNALAHGTWTIEDGYVVLFSDSRLVPFERLALHKFMDRTQELGILCSCLACVVAEKRKTNFFA